ncbi:hypothetical protein [Paenibacillus periandrae]|uniref:hypothetical protein n=1 Tax=Paenibacillus periandrae TaxID=1761741 RepID=UPI001F08B681|nr:hypothetical protein [Paenibacillus periandrae]
MNIPNEPPLGGSTETSTDLDLPPAEKNVDYEIEFVKNQNRIMSLWNEIIQ